jgi:hypothetical protein
LAQRVLSPDHHPLIMSRQKNKTSAYYLRSIPPDLWESVTAKAKSEGRNIRWVILHALRDWLDGAYEPASKEAGGDRTGASERDARGW